MRKISSDENTKRTKRRKVFFATVATTLILGTLVGGVVYQYSNVPLMTYEDVSTGTANDLINDFDALDKKIKEKYSGRPSLSIKETSHKYVRSINISQGKMNEKYNDKHYTKEGRHTTYTGTCSEVAVTILTVMYANSDNPDQYATFEDVFDYAIENGYFDTESKDGGTYPLYIDKIMNYALDLYSSTKDKDARDAYWNVYDTLKANADKDKLTLFNIKGHSMVGAGYYECEVTWKEIKRFLFWSWEKWYTDNLRYAVVNQGWFDKEPDGEIDKEDFGKKKVYQLFPADKIGSTFIGSLLGASPYFNVTIS